MNPPRKCFNGCKYHAIPFSGYTCEYMLSLSKRRPCPADACTAYEIGKRQFVPVKPKLSKPKPDGKRGRRPLPEYEVALEAVRKYGLNEGIRIAAEKLGKDPNAVRVWLWRKGIRKDEAEGGINDTRPPDNTQS